jgi:hypothetical protein
MSQESPKIINTEDNNAAETHAEDASPQNPKVSEIEIDQEGIVVNVVPLNMIPPREGSTKKKKKTKRTTSKKIKSTKKGSFSDKSSKPNKEINQDEPRNSDQRVKDSETIPFKDPEPHDKPSEEASTQASPDEPQNENLTSVDPPTNIIPPPETTMNIPTGPQEE